MTDALAEPLTEVLAVALTPPMIQLYAVLWRVGVLEIRETRARPSSTVPALLSA